MSSEKVGAAIYAILIPDGDGECILALRDPCQGQIIPCISINPDVIHTMARRAKHSSCGKKFRVVRFVLREDVTVEFTS